MSYVDIKDPSCYALQVGLTGLPVGIGAAALQRATLTPQAMRRLTLEGAAYKAAGVSSASRRYHLKYVPLALEYLLVPGGMLIAAGDHALIFPARPSERGDRRDNAAKGGQHDIQIHKQPTLCKIKSARQRKGQMLFVKCAWPSPACRAVPHARRLVLSRGVCGGAWRTLMQIRRA